MKKIVNVVAGVVTTTIVLSGCSSAQLKLNSKENADLEVSVENFSEDEINATSDDSEDDISKNENDATEGKSEEDITEEDVVEDDTTDETGEGDSENTNVELSEYDSPEMIEGEALSEAELEKLQEYLNQEDNYGFTLASYKNADQIDWGDVLAYGAGIENCDYSQEALNAYLDADDEFDSVEYDLIALSGEDVRTLVENKTGITDFDPSMISGYIYVEDYDIFFKQISDYYDKNVFCKEGVRDGNRIQIVFQVGYQDNRRRITLEETGDSDNPYRFVSNRELWEENADKTMEVSVYDTDDKIICAIVSTDDGPNIWIIEDNAVVMDIHPRFYASEKVDISEYSDVKEIKIHDVDDDGLYDMITVLSNGQKTIAVVNCGCKDGLDNLQYAMGKSAVTNWLSDNVSEITADNVIDYILEHQDEFKEL
ncbi:MAG: hypothetical protein K6G87_16785 [Butyrivibrio sp.]|uniref:hypothetical protein n=1 Tax=Butyrivibrio sp. TaxID=28121 RepID=UPI0025E7EED6|nr:hypothetical protein [Butyrivibrio sp.]MCR5772881.1 hypothetical protein [Butyrivibrio sp.]